MTTTVIINGAFGKMGQVACEFIASCSEFQLVARLGRDDNLAQSIAKTRARIVIDLTRADCAYANCKTIIDQGASPIIGTSGLTDDQINALMLQCQRQALGGLVIPNFSICAVLMMQFAALAAPYLAHVEIIESHHLQKFDAPSGTAIKTAAMIASKQQPLTQSTGLNSDLSASRGEMHCGIPIHALRLPGILAQQQVIFGQAGETLSINHCTIDRISFMPGLLLCCQKVTQLTTLCYGLEHLLSI